MNIFMSTGTMYEWMCSKILFIMKKRENTHEKAYWYHLTMFING
jgi:hypothetical protein